MRGKWVTENKASVNLVTKIYPVFSCHVPPAAVSLGTGILCRLFSLWTLTENRVPGWRYVGRNEDWVGGAAVREGRKGKKGQWRGVGWSKLVWHSHFIDTSLHFIVLKINCVFIYSSTCSVRVYGDLGTLQGLCWPEDILQGSPSFCYVRPGEGA